MFGNGNRVAELLHDVSKLKDENKQLTHDAINAKQDASDMAWMIRASFEMAWRQAGGDGDEWQDAWKASKPRAVLVEMGYIQEWDDYR